MNRALICLQLVAINAALALASCGHVAAEKPESAASPAAHAPDPRICADLEAEPAVAGGLVRPANQAEHDAVQAFLNGELDLLFWGRRGWGRAELARDQYCPPS